MINRLKKRIAEEPTEEPEEVKEPSGIDLMADKVLDWLWRKAMPVLAVALAVDILIMFTVPIEITMSQWFWLKDPLSIAIAVLACHVLKHLRPASDRRDSKTR